MVSRRVRLISICIILTAGGPVVAHSPELRVGCLIIGAHPCPSGGKQPDIAVNLLEAVSTGKSLTLRYFRFSDRESLKAAFLKNKVDIVFPAGDLHLPLNEALLSLPYKTDAAVSIGRNQKEKSATGRTALTASTAMLLPRLKKSLPAGALLFIANEEEALRQLVSGGVDEVFLTRHLATPLLEKKEFHSLALLGPLGFQTEIIMALRPQETDLLMDINSRILAIHGQESLSRQRKTRHEYHEFLLLTVLLIIAIALVLVTLAWSRSLKKGSDELNERLTLTRKFLQQIVDSVPDAIFLKDEESRFVFVNPAFADLYGRKPVDFIGRRNSEIHTNQEELEGYLKTDKTVIQSRKSLMTEESHTQDDGTIRNFRTLKFPMEIAPGEIWVLGIATDMTRIRRSEQELKKAAEIATNANAAKTDFLANMSHELRTPLNGVLGFTGLLSETDLSEEQREFVNRIRSSGNNLLDILSDILDISRIERGEILVRMTDFRLSDLADEVIKLFDANCREKGLTFVVELPPDLPLHIRSDFMKLRQVLVNLVANAVKFTDKGGIFVHFSGAPGTQKGEKTEFTIHVRDTGIGIARENLRKIFGRFQQADPSITRRFGGSGLGLSISKSLMKLIGGDLIVESVPDQGSTFTIVFQAEPVEAPLEPGKPIGPSGKFRGKLLVAEDLELNRMLLKSILHKYDLEAVFAVDGEEAVRHFTPDIDLILMDIQLPNKDGLQATEEIRAMLHGREVPIVALTAEVMRLDREKCREAGINDIIFKPFRQSDLETIFQKYLKTA